MGPLECPGFGVLSGDMEMYNLKTQFCHTKLGLYNMEVLAWCMLDIDL